MPSSTMTRMLFWQLALSSMMFGLEAVVAIEIILMMSNLQTLGTPISYTSIPGIVAAAIGVILIPTLGFAMDRWRHKGFKATIVTLTVFLALLGSVCIFFANGLAFKNVSNLTSSLNLSAEAAIQSYSPSFALHSTPSYAKSSNFTTQPSSMTSELEISKIDVYNNDLNEEISWTAYLAIAGYAMVGYGYIAGSCFFKTFLLHCSPSDFHSSVILKSIAIASFGGLSFVILCYINPGQTLTSDTNFDPDAVLSCFVAGVGVCTLILGYLISMMTGIFWSPPINIYQLIDNNITKRKRKSVIGLRYNPTISENSGLISPSPSRTHGSWHFQSESRNEAIMYNSATTEEADKRFNFDDDPSMDLPKAKGFVAFVLRHRKQILINMVACCLFSSIFCYMVHCVNFVGEGIFEGDPSAPKDSPEYLVYLDGVAASSHGTLIYYVSFAVFSLIHEKSLALIGWKVEAIIAIAAYSGLSLATALTLNLWVYYVTTASLGVLRAVTHTTPYILANKFAAEQNEGKVSGTAIALVSTMLLSGYLLCTTIMGPLTSATGDPGTSLYFTSASACLGLAFVILLKD